MTEHLDVLIVGAGISGISAAWHLQDRCPSKTYAILERRENMGGTWDLFKYPGIRSDSDMFTLGFRFKPWTSAKAIADGPSILAYIKEAAAENGIDKNIRYSHRVVAADWSDADNRWTVTVDTRRRRDHDDLLVPVRLHRLLQLRPGLLADVPRLRGLRGHDRAPAALAGGPRLRGQEDRRDRQRRHRHHADPRPGQQRRRPRHDAAALADLHRLAARRRPDRRRRPTSTCPRRPPTWSTAGRPSSSAPRSTSSPASSRSTCARRCSPWPSAGCPRATTSRSTSARSYNPWDQRLCLAPNGDLFKTIRKGNADVVTDTIDTFVPEGIKLQLR